MQYLTSKKGSQMSDAFSTAVFLTLSGGFQDAYTYFCRDGVFANAQTGNIVFMSSYFMKGDFAHALRYLLPLFAFVAGIFTAEGFRRKFKYLALIHWRQLVLFTEILILFFVGFIPDSHNILANCLVSFVCAMQVQSFRKLDGYTYASTMCIGNLRSGTDAIAHFLHSRDHKYLERAASYFSIIFLFAIGAGTGSVMASILSIRAIWLSCLFLTFSLCLMFIREEKN
jgi:uncharacterized membrane protein YoaK (UPF0700 family)